ncbi:MAG TPA: hypothetical protein VFK05_29000 [Polyangiaceae bacterium]|nr:hypothetical protein [Polyangiaceae bacterium]
MNRRAALVAHVTPPARPRSFALMARLALIALALSAAGCSSTSSCDRDADEFTVSDGLVIGNTYISAPNDAQHRGPWAPFPPARTLIFEHKLGGVPYQMSLWLAFQDKGTLALASGNLAIRQRTPDDTTIAFKNDTCSNFYAWVEASLPVGAPAGGEAGASGNEPSDAAGASGAQ